MSSSSPAEFPLAQLNAHLQKRLPVLIQPLQLGAQEPMRIGTLMHIFSDAPFQAKPSDAPLSSLIDHTILKADARVADVERLCEEALKYQFATVCVNGSRVADAVAFFAQRATGTLASADQKPPQLPGVCAVVGFPLGAMTSTAKATEAAELLALGAREIDMVINVGFLKDRAYTAVYEDIKRVADEVHKANASREDGAPRRNLKVILETSLLTDEEIIDACLLCAFVGGVAFVKTSTGFSTGGATVHHVRLMRAVVGEACEVKASGGIRDAKTAREMVEAGATRLGCSAGVAICASEQPSANEPPTVAATASQAANVY